MNLAIAQTQPEQPVMRVARDEEKAFKTCYMEGLNLVTITGWSVTNNVGTKYNQLLTDIKTHFQSSTTLRIHFRYDLFNSASLRYLFQIIKAMNEAHAKGNEVKVYWSCATESNDEMLAMGMDLASMSDFKFETSYS